MALSLYATLARRLTQIRLTENSAHPALPYKYIFVITNRCNSRCLTCNTWKLYREHPERLKDEMTTDEVTRTMHSVKDAMVWLNFTGGEPLLREDLLEIIRYARDHCAHLQIVNIPINGLLPDLAAKFFPQAIAACRGKDLYVTLSLDGLEAEHEKIRGVPGGYKKIMEAHRILQDLAKKHSNFILSSQLTISRYNLETALETFDFMASQDLPIVTFAHVGELFHNPEMSLDSPEDRQAIRTLAHNIYRRYPVKNFQALLPKAYLKFTYLFFENSHLPVPCHSGRSTTTIDPYGLVSPCPYLGRYSGNVRDYDYDLPKIFATEQARELRRVAQACNICWQNCEAMPTIMAHPLLSIWKFLTK
jgi:MoaA/NifB/PqqE/SkfB family radical SAM enzyme